MKRIIAITGMAGSGKALTSDVARQLGCPVFVCGDVVREEVRRLGLPPTPENTGRIMLRIREEEGPAVVAKRLSQMMLACDAPALVVEGIRNPEEIEELRGNFGSVTVVAIHASSSTRFDRLRMRGRPDDPHDWNEFEGRDVRELKVGIGNVIAQADEMIVNEGSIDELTNEAIRVFQEILNDDQSSYIS
ncbi:MAG: AAA family ATPase [archaeon]